MRLTENCRVFSILRMVRWKTTVGVWLLSAWSMVFAQEAVSVDGASAAQSVESDLAKPETTTVTEREPWQLQEALDPKVRITSVREFLNDPSETRTGGKRPLEFEFKYVNHGAVTQAQKRNRMGNYFTVNWQASGEPADYELRLDYRQSRSKDLVRTLIIPYKSVTAGQKGHFKVIGDAYHDFGRVHSWRISVVRNGVIVAQQKSFVW